MFVSPSLGRKVSRDKSYLSVQRSSAIYVGIVCSQGDHRLTFESSLPRSGDIGDRSPHILAQYRGQSLAEIPGLWFARR